MSNKVNIWTDGSSSNNGKPNCLSGWASCFQIRGRWYVRYGPNDDRVQNSNNRGEIGGVLYASLMMAEMKTLQAHIVSDSQYVINSLTKWRHNWEKQGRNDYSNADLFRPLFDSWDASGHHTIEWCRGHTGVPGNELADEWSARGRKREQKRVESEMYDIKYITWEEVDRMIKGFYDAKR